MLFLKLLGAPLGLHGAGNSGEGTSPAGDGSIGSVVMQLRAGALASVLARVSSSEWMTRSQRRTRELQRSLDELSAPIAVFDLADGAPRLANTAWRAWSSEQPLPAEIRSGLRASVRGDTAIEVPEIAIDPHRVGYVASLLTPIRNAREVRVGTLAVCADITDAVIARVLKINPGALVWSGRARHEADYHNRTYLTYVGRPHGSALDSVFHAADASRDVDGHAEMMREPRTARLRRFDGTYRWHEVRFAMMDERWFAIAIDNHETHELERERAVWIARVETARAEAERANRLKDEFLAKVSHELRSPVTTMMLWEQVLRDPTADGPSRDRALDAIGQSAAMQSRLVGDLLDVSRGINGKLHLDLRPLEIDRLVREAVAFATPKAMAKSISLRHQATGSIGGIHGDASRLRQVMDNLLSNAIKFSNAGGRITVSTRRRGRGIVIEVEDAGRGIAAEHLSRIFEPFNQAGETRSYHEGGLGLGLAISKQIIEHHFGTIEASSPGIGRGTTLTITLPPTHARQVVPARVSAPRDLADVRLLVVDDDESVRVALALLLVRRGASTRIAESAVRGHAMIAESRPDLVICDVKMPGEDGYAFIRHVRERGDPLPAIALTAYATERDQQRAIEAGFDVHIPKPIALDSLVATIRRLVAPSALPQRHGS